MTQISPVGANPLIVANGGTGAATLTGVLVGNGTSAVTAVTSLSSIIVDTVAATQAMAISTGYLSDHASALVVFTLPATASRGDVMQIFGNGPGGWQINQNANQAIKVASQTSTTGTGGSVSSTSRYNSITLTCVVGGASTIWNASDFSGTLTVV